MADVPVAGDAAREFVLLTTEGELRGSDLWRTGKLLIAFYTEDGTPTCQTEVMGFAEELPMLTELGTRVIGVSSDSIESHKRFAEKVGGIPFPLGSDTDLTVARLYGVADETTGRSRRAVFVIDQNGTVLHANPWYNPANPQQVAEIYGALGLEL